jgi:hypothetical protein
MKSLKYLMAFLAMLGAGVYLYGIIEAGLISLAKSGKLNDLWVTAISIIGGVLATNFGAVLGISFSTPPITNGFAAERFMLFRWPGPASSGNKPMSSNNTGTGPKKIQIIASWIYILSLLCAVVFWIIASSKNSSNIQGVITQLFHTLIGVAAGALTVILGNNNANSNAPNPIPQQLQKAKSLITIVLFLIVGQFTKAQVSTLVPSFKVPSGFALAAGSSTNELVKGLSLVRIGGLGNISNSVNTTNFDPSANINVEFALPGKGHFEKNIWLYLNYNIGSAQDSATVDSIKLGSFFFPDKSKNGFAAGLSIDLARIIKNWRVFSIEQPMEIEAGRKYMFYMLEPYVEYSYQRRNIKDVNVAASRIESSTWLFGIRSSLRYIINDNNFALIFNLYRKSIIFTDATFPYYNNVFQKTNNDQPLPQKNSLWGLNIGMQLNKAVFGFTYESLITKGIFTNDISGGVFILRATISAEFFDFK